MKKILSKIDKKAVITALITGALGIAIVVCAIGAIKHIKDPVPPDETQSSIEVDTSEWGKLVSEGLVTVQGTTLVAVKPEMSGTLTVSDKITAIGDNAFNSCDKLTGVIFEGEIKSIGDSAFYNCTSLTGEIVLPESVTSIGSYAFYGCTGITKIVIPESVKTIGNRAFMFCSGLTGEFVVPDSVAEIEDSTFYGCSGFTKITLGKSVEHIGSYVFYGCSALTDINIPASVKGIGDSAFLECSALANINYAGTEDEWKNVSLGKDWDKGLENYKINYSKGTEKIE